MRSMLLLSPRGSRLGRVGVCVCVCVFVDVGVGPPWGRGEVCVCVCLDGCALFFDAVYKLVFGGGLLEPVGEGGLGVGVGEEGVEG